MIDLDEMKRDMEAGTQGPWVSGHYEDIAEEIEVQTAESEYVASIDCDGCFDGKIAKCILVNARRIARVPDMEAAIIAQAATIEALTARVAKADELAVATDKLARFAFYHMLGGRQDLVDNAAAALRAYRATGGAE
jgi:hypothetical protein